MTVSVTEKVDKPETVSESENESSSSSSSDSSYKSPRKRKKKSSTDSSYSPESRTEKNPPSRKSPKKKTRVQRLPSSSSDSSVALATSLKGLVDDVTRNKGSDDMFENSEGEDTTNPMANILNPPLRMEHYHMDKPGNAGKAASVTIQTINVDPETGETQTVHSEGNDDDANANDPTLSVFDSLRLGKSQKSATARSTPSVRGGGDRRGGQGDKSEESKNVSSPS